MRDNKSTNVRAQVEAWLRYGLGTEWELSPEGAAEMAAQLFLSPAERRPKSAVEADVFARARCSTISFDGETLPVFRFGHGPAVLLLHGWCGSSGQLHHFIEPLLAAGRSVVTFDAPGHGDATGTLLHIPRFARAILRVTEEAGPIEAVIGHSMGGAAAAYATSLGLTADRFVLIGPPGNELAMFEQWVRSLGFGSRLAELTKARVEEQVGIPFARLLPQPMAATVRAPLLVIHDRDDREVPFADGAAFAASAPNGRLWATKGLGHRRILRDAGVIEVSTDFAVGHLPRSASTEMEASNPAWM